MPPACRPFTPRALLFAQRLPRVRHYTSTSSRSTITIASTRTPIANTLLHRCLSPWVIPHCRRHATTVAAGRGHGGISRPLQSGKPSASSKPSQSAQPNRAPYVPRNYPGPPPPPGAKKRKRYPNTFPEAGSFMHWFLTSKWIHIVITMGTLSTLVVVTLNIDFRRNSPYAHLLPAREELLWHPIKSIKQCIEVYLMDVDYTSNVVVRMRRKRVDDVVKRAEYRKAHGLEDKDSLWGWSVRLDDQPVKKTGWTGSAPVSPGARKTYDENESEQDQGHDQGQVQVEVQVPVPSQSQDTIQSAGGVGGAGGGEEVVASTVVAREAAATPGQEQEGGEGDGEGEGEKKEVKYKRQRMFTDSQGNRRPLKMWFGIW